MGQARNRQEEINKLKAKKMIYIHAVRHRANGNHDVLCFGSDSTADRNISKSELLNYICDDSDWNNHNLTASAIYEYVLQSNAYRDFGTQGITCFEFNFHQTGSMKDMPTHHACRDVVGFPDIESFRNYVKSVADNNDRVVFNTEFL